ncbi:MAG: hypothetical protein LQ352_002178 [Teloschistes flavicans]|nr:MAG: hypothetical protein LQ352_002178 [Teloschistes flavicans]
MARKRVPASNIHKRPIRSKDTASMPPEPNQIKQTGPSLTNNKKRSFGAPHAPDLAPPALHPSKRQRIDIEKSLVSISSRSGASFNSTSIGPLDVGDSSLPPEIQKLRGQYCFSTMTVISSSKIQQKVKTLLAHVEKPKLSDKTSKDEVVILEAKAATASKMISIVEIAKAAIATRNGEWYQYSSLRAETLPHQKKQKKKPSQDLQAPTNQASGQEISSEPSKRPQPPAAKTMSNDDSEDEAAAFETLQYHPAATDGVKAGKVRTTPIVTIYFSGVPVSGLKNLLG